ncbi:hypothetical protein BJ138DRAFT_1228948 [Hygrophoropsis aurantiaca]|uniref:Uncharacterized protein n=1 Tax=Hygrophoropsis aurantiaca TaxID=72124 RepID=A0ACB7ZX81_9AGAM|nr:hypothetical protein BJ138DRAFT_1228948 [Hygrophoropsis aurantiaca]
MSTLQTAPLDIGATSHEELDRAVLGFLRLLGLNRCSPDKLSLIDLARILSIILLSSESLFDEKYSDADEAEQLLIGHPELQEAIREAFKERSFANVRNIKMLWSSSAKAFEPRQMDGFVEYLKANNRKFSQGNYYGKFCSIVQSSGTGKSRLMVELRHRKVIVVYMNLRSGNDDSFPERCHAPKVFGSENMNYRGESNISTSRHIIRSIKMP